MVFEEYLDKLVVKLWIYTKTIRLFALDFYLVI